MNAKIYSNGLDMGNGIYSFSSPMMLSFDTDSLTPHMVAERMAELGLFKGKTFQSQEDDNGAVIIGQRYVPMFIAVSETHPTFGRNFIVSRKMPKIVK